MPTKTLKRLKSKARSKPAAAAHRLHKKSMYVFLFFVVMASVATGLLVFKIWVPGLAWLV